MNECGITVCTGRFDWVCVSPVHDDGPDSSSRKARRGAVPKADRHHFVRMYPWR